MLLSDLCVGDKFRIVKVAVGEAVGKRLVDMGLNRGVEGVLVRCAMLGDPVQIRILGYNLSLRLAEAAGVVIELLEHGNGRRHRHGRGGGPGGRGRGGMGRGFGGGSGRGRGPGHGRGPGFGRNRRRDEIE